MIELVVHTMLREIFYLPNPHTAFGETSAFEGIIVGSRFLHPPTVPAGFLTPPIFKFTLSAKLPGFDFNKSCTKQIFLIIVCENLETVVKHVLMNVII